MAELNNLLQDELSLLKGQSSVRLPRISNRSKGSSQASHHIYNSVK